MTTNNKWEEKTKDEVESFVISILDAENQTEQNQAVEDFMEVISKIEQDAYNRGKEETEINLEADRISRIQEIEQQYKDGYKDARQETLEKVKEMIEKMAVLTTTEQNSGGYIISFNYIDKDILLQELNNI